LEVPQPESRKTYEPEARVEIPFRIDPEERAAGAAGNTAVNVPHDARNATCKPDEDRRAHLGFRLEDAPGVMTHKCFVSLNIGHSRQDGLIAVGHRDQLDALDPQSRNRLERFLWISAPAEYGGYA
jgi:hypothetical protein